MKAFYASNLYMDLYTLVEEIRKTKAMVLASIGHPLLDNEEI